MYADTQRTAVYVCAHEQRKGVKEDVPETQRERARASKRARERERNIEMGWKKILALLLSSECQVIYIVILSHIFYRRVKRESILSAKKHVLVVFPSSECINNSRLIVICCCWCGCCCYCCCCSLLAPIVLYIRIRIPEISPFAAAVVVVVARSLSLSSHMWCIY